MKRVSRFYLLLCTGLICSLAYHAAAQTPQGNGFGGPGQPPRDTSMNKTNDGKWRNESSRTSYRRLNSDVERVPDTSIHTFHRRPFLQPWYRDLGNPGTPAQNLLFTTEPRLGPTLGYHVFDAYAFLIDSLPFYNTNRPYSEFMYQLGSKLEQVAGIMHTQNVKPNWNIAAAYRKINAPGFYQQQRSSNDNAYLSTHYQSKNLHYELFGGVVYNKAQQDENGGIVSDTFLTRNYNDRQTVPVRFQDASFGNGGTVKRSPVVNTFREATVFLQHSYTLGKIDTLYNEDSTKYSYQLTPRFGISHRFEYGGEKHIYKDKRPDSLRYSDFFRRKFAGTDSVFSIQKWYHIDNRIMLNGFIGKRENQLQFSAGIGNRYDRFSTEFIVDKLRYSVLSNYLAGSLRKEALKPGAWFYNANAIFYLTGDAAGNSLIDANLGKTFGDNNANISVGIRQEINNAPYNYTSYYNQFDTITHSFNKESVTQVHATLYSERFKFSAGFRNYLISNYIYLDQLQMPAQYAGALNITQIWGRKLFVWRSLAFDNEIVFQQPTSGAPVNVPTLMGRHQLSLERYIFKRALKIATGAEVRYHTPYKPAGYSPFFNRYYYQDTYSLTNNPEGAVFFNFKVRSFRATIMADQVQQLFGRNTIVAPGYATQNFMIRFCFNWTLIN